MLASGLPAVIALAELGVIVWLWLSRRDDRRKITELTLRARQAELRAVPIFSESFEWPAQLRREQGSECTD